MVDTAVEQVRQAANSAAVTPVIPGFHPDPTICRVGEDYYLSTSSFEYFPGAPIFHSRDLVAWEQIGNILTRRSQFAVGDGRSSGGIFGSTLRHHNGEFWFVTTNMSDFGGGHLLLRANEAAGPWSEPVQIPGTLGIDPDIAWDSEGNCYLTWVGFGPAENESGIVQARLDLDAGRLLESPKKVWQGTGLAYPEGPHLYEVGGWWYLLLAEGGTERGHAVSISRASSPEGPFEPCSANPILSHRSTAAPVQNVGHADLVETSDGDWAAVYLGVRPRGVVPGYHVLGRETFVAGISWEDGWPRFDQDRYQVPAADSSFTDDFSSEGLHHRWISPGNDPDTFTAHSPSGLLIGQSNTGSAPILATRVPGLMWSARASVLLSGDAAVRFLLRIDGTHWYAIEASGPQIRVLAQVGPLQQVLATAEISPTSDPLQLVISCSDSPLAGQPGKNTGPDEVTLAFRDRGRLTTLASLDGRYLSTEVAGGFTGRVIGLSALRGRVVMKRFEYDHQV
ncbi:glycoside hydrolase family 43 protein [Arthrobacter sp. 18067]|uniref:glycoside hydrolase family 43 protein n=1 Tax=Arthrobacter sp. 18067 TaxID=2681413 RepID=UPI0013576080|nr:glycoside hydrolase family 43 protein [Arthrobacter sp. 18067]